MILIAGGFASELDLRSVELYNPKTGFSCFITPLPDYLSYLSPVASGLKVCGGGNRDCVEFYFEFEGIWNASNTLLDSREASSGWGSSQGLVLMGGYTSQNTTEILVEDYSRYHFNLTTHNRV